MYYIHVFKIGLMKRAILFFLLLTIPVFILCRCNKAGKQSDVAYSFFAAGHVYGNPSSIQYGVHPPFEEAIDFLNGYPEMAFGVFTGDVVPRPTPEYWDSVQADFNKLEMPYYIAAGNHDKGAEFDSRYGKPYYSFKRGNDLFIVMAPTNWNIDRDQLKFLKQTFADNVDSTRNIFIFIHELIWWSPENRFNLVEINYRPHYPGSTNYREVIDPLLRETGKNVVVYAGDVGCNQKVSPCMYYKYENITLIASGMGSGDKDNLVITRVFNDGSFDFQLIHLNGNNKNGMGKLEDYRVK
jgi:hypothetical protein